MRRFSGGTEGTAARAPDLGGANTAGKVEEEGAIINGAAPRLGNWRREGAKKAAAKRAFRTRAMARDGPGRWTSLGQRRNVQGAQIGGGSDDDIHAPHGCGAGLLQNAFYRCAKKTALLQNWEAKPLRRLVAKTKLGKGALVTARRGETSYQQCDSDKPARNECAR